MDLDAVDLERASEEGVEIQIFTPAGDPTDLFVTVVGQDSLVYEQVQARHRREAAANFGKLMRNQRVGDETADRQEIEICAACVKAWRGFESGSQPIAFSKRTVEEVLGRRGNKWIREQVLRAIGDRTLFFRGSAKA